MCAVYALRVLGVCGAYCNRFVHMAKLKRSEVNFISIFDSNHAADSLLIFFVFGRVGCKIHI